MLKLSNFIAKNLLSFNSIQNIWVYWKNVDLYCDSNIVLKAILYLREEQVDNVIALHCNEFIHYYSIFKSLGLKERYLSILS